MKKIAITASLAVLGFTITAFVTPKVSGDKPFEGVVTYSVNIDNPQAAAMMQGSSVKVYIKGDKTKTMINMGMQKITIFEDRKNPNNPVKLLEAMDNKYQVKEDPNKKDDAKDPVIKYVDTTKTIAGYTCHKAEVTLTDQQGQSYTSTVYYTEDLPYFTGKKDIFKGLKGFPMEYAMKQQGINISFTATSVDKQAVPDDTFTIPTGYKLMTMEEIMQDVQKQMSGGN